MLNRKRFIREINEKKLYASRVWKTISMNSPIQGSAADIIKVAIDQMLM